MTTVTKATSSEGKKERKQNVPKPKDEFVVNPLPAYIRFYCYAVQGFCDEIIFTSVLDFVKNGNWKLRGHSSMSTFLIYGSCSFLVERLYVYLWYKRRIPRYIRMPLYLLITYSWEFTTGMILRQFNACPWDYSNYRYNFMGLITLEYAPGWLFLSFMQDIFADYLLRCKVVPAAKIGAIKPKEEKED